MTATNWPSASEPRSAAEAQSAAVLRDYGDYVEAGPPDWRERGGIRYYVRRGFVLVRDEYTERARAILGQVDLPPVEAPDRPRTQRQHRPDGDRERLLRPPVDGDVVHGLRYIGIGRDRSVFGALAALRAGIRSGEDFTQEPLSPADVGPEHLIHITDHSGICPADEPSFVLDQTPPDPPLCEDREAGRGVRVLVIDTGLDHKTVQRRPWLAGVTGDPDPGVGNGTLARYAGHGTFIAGVIRAVAPAAEVIVRAGLPAYLIAGETNPPGTAFERDLVAALQHHLAHDHPDIISLSAGSQTDEPAKLMVLEAFQRRILSQYKGIVVVAAAGNDSDRAPFWPAAGPWAVGVGALAANWRSRASFSNFGAWVDVYAPGERLVNAFPSGTYSYQEPPRSNNTQRFDGMAAWSGTSFSTPLVAGLIAARMSYTGENGPAAAAALIAQARRDAIPGVGAVLLPPERRISRQGCDV
ncbi:S8 family peptidase [Dactylosporangium sp. CS-047395]|uniref:S8 family peptidase n=1 Tax=Dactylosporangium sp. CS-047395 TaxID=3239936 RepID=UPI003D946045